MKLAVTFINLLGLLLSIRSFKVFYVHQLGTISSTIIAFQSHNGIGNRYSGTAIFEGYGFFPKSNERKDIGRLIKNIIFPGIYQTYEDTKEVKKTIKIEYDKFEKSRYTQEEIAAEKKQVAGYNMVFTKDDLEKSQKALPRVMRPMGFVAPAPNRKATGTGGGVACLPDVAKYSKPKKPLVLYDDEANGNCRKVREACSMLDLPLEIRPCP